MNRWKTSLDVFIRKRNLVTRSSGNNATRAGNYLEDGVGRWAADKMNWKLHRCGRTYRHTEYRWMLATLDRQIVSDTENQSPRFKRIAVVEIKTSGYPEDWGIEMTDEIPIEIRLQCQQQLTVCRSRQPELTLNYVPVFFFPTREHRIYLVEHSPVLEEAIIESGETFWNDCVLAGEPPEFDASSESAAKYIAAVTSQTSRAIVPAPAVATAWAAQLLAANTTIDTAESLKREAEFHLREMVGENKGISGDWGRYLWYTAKSGGTAWKALCAEMFAVLRAGGLLTEQGQAKLIGNHQRPGSRKPRFTPRKD